VKVITSKCIYEDFDASKIVNSLVKETGLSEDEAFGIALEVTKKLNAMGDQVITASMIREMVCGTLIKYGCMEERNAYTRLGMPVKDVTQVIEQGSRDNANLHHNPETVHKFMADQLAKEYALTLLPQNVKEAHLKGFIHLHDLDYFMFRPNCLTHDLGWFFENGLRVDGTGNHTSVAAPPKHAMVAALHAAKILASSQTNMAGGQSFDNFNIYMAPYMRGLGPNEIKQVAQAFVYEMNMQYVARGGQVVFSSINLEATIPKYLWDTPAYINGKKAGKLPDYWDEMFKFTHALLDVFLEGDASGKPHLFPNTVLKVRPDTFKYPEPRELAYKVHQIFAKYGTPYILNLCPEWQHDAVNAMGCRTRLSGDWADKQGYSDMVGGTLRTGNLQYVTLNLPRLAIMAERNHEAFYDWLNEYLDIVRQSLEIKHNYMERLLKVNNVLPFLSQKGKDGEMYYRWDDLTHTVGFVGLNECLRILYNTELHEDKAGHGLTIIKYLRNWADELTDETGWRWTVTQSPAETTAGRFASLDLRDYPTFAKPVINGTDKAPYYTNSSHIKVSADVPLFERAKIEGQYHKLCNGGHITHLFMGEGHPAPEGLLSLTEKLCKNTGMGLFDYTKDITVCKACAAVSGGLSNTCANCGSGKVEWYSRITGYCQRIGQGGQTGGWNDYKLSELADRRRY
jgi:anaerobic ribonucleoside-triphosphate reductase